jgi:hypothetical protein
MDIQVRVLVQESRRATERRRDGGVNCGEQVRHEQDNEVDDEGGRDLISPHAEHKVEDFEIHVSMMDEGIRGPQTTGYGDKLPWRFSSGACLGTTGVVLK